LAGGSLTLRLAASAAVVLLAGTAALSYGRNSGDRDLRSALLVSCVLAAIVLTAIWSQ
jgi:hypothetical protein